MADIKPIETIYNGYRFRSRLEARWAVFFDALCIAYQYEPEGFECGWNDDEPKYRYLPDFYLTKYKCYVEVKATDESLFNDGRKLSFAVDFNQTPCSDGLLILGEIPNYEQMSWGNIPMFSCLYNHKGVVHQYATFLADMWHGYLVRGYNNIISGIFSFDEEDYSDCFSEPYIPQKTSTSHKWTKECLLSRSDWGLLKEAYKKARQARFEHGETPVAPKRVEYDKEIPF